MRRVHYRAPLAAVVIAIAAVAGGSVVWRTSRGRVDVDSPRPEGANAGAAFTGSQTCAACHNGAYDAWRSSQHHDAMQPASAATVKGRFDGGEFRYGGVVSTFFQRDGRYWVRTDGPDGTLADFEIKYTFGVDPLQQYLIELGNGRVQALSIAWDTRPAGDGGQRWFHLYPGQQIAHGDELHWTGRQQNWNFMCADCHSTNLRKNYDAASDTFRTTWSEINVACEACHGPGSRHVEWARQAGTRGPDNGLTVQLTERRNVSWSIDPTALTPVRSAPRTTAAEIDTCAQCHSRRTQFADGYYAGAPLQNFYEPATLDSPLYYPDGQQREEVYTHASFLQSRMAHAGVTCSDCHEPHTARLRAPGNALCTSCHAASRYDAPAHHRHRVESAGASCVACHMPARTYMEIDARRDHSLRVPRPDMTVAAGVPNACTGCHADRPAAWAASAVKTWLGRDAAGFQRFAATFHEAEQGRPGARPALLGLATSGTEPAIVRASAFARLDGHGAPMSALVSGLRDADPLVRRSALRTFDSLPPDARVAYAQPLLADPIRAIRMAAAQLLAPLAMHAADRPAFDRASAEFVDAARFNADRPESRVSLGVFLADLGRVRDAEDEYRAAIRLAPDFTPGYVNLGELLRTTRSEYDAEQVLRDGLARNPNAAELHYALGLSLTRSRRPGDAMAAFKRASDMAPEVARFPYAYALALDAGGERPQALQVLTAALTRHPDDRDLLFVLAAFEREAGRLASARRYADRLVARYPDDGEARALADSLREPRRN